MNLLLHVRLYFGAAVSFLLRTTQDLQSFKTKKIKTMKTCQPSPSGCSGSSCHAVNSSKHLSSVTSKTFHYKKVTKPLLERKRRARINQYLNELKNLISDTLHVEEENINKLEKADILELTVKHMHCLAKETQSKPIEKDIYRFQAGYSQCAFETKAFLSNLTGLKYIINDRLLQHLEKYSPHRSANNFFSSAIKETTYLNGCNVTTSTANECCGMSSSSDSGRNSQISFKMSNSSNKSDLKVMSTSTSFVSGCFRNDNNNLFDGNRRPMWRPW